MTSGPIVRMVSRPSLSSRLALVRASSRIEEHLGDQLVELLGVSESSLLFCRSLVTRKPTFARCSIDLFFGLFTSKFSSLFGVGRGDRGTVGMAVIPMSHILTGGCR